MIFKFWLPSQNCLKIIYDQIIDHRLSFIDYPYNYVINDYRDVEKSIIMMLRSRLSFIAITINSIYSTALVTATNHLKFVESQG